MGRATVLAWKMFGDVRVEAVLGDLTLEDVDAVVNAANSDLVHGGGLAGAISRAGGVSIQEESSRLAPVGVGGAVVTGAGALKCRWVIHAVGPRWGEGEEESKLRSAVRSAMNAAADLGAISVALPAISTGIFGYPKEIGTRQIVDELVDWLGSNPGSGIEGIRLTAFDRSTANLFAAALDQRPSTEDSGDYRQ